MSSEERNTWVSVVVSLGAYVTYLAIILRRAAETPLAEVSYASTLLWTIGIAIVARIVLTIITTIVAAIVSPKDVDRTDERDKAIGRFGEFVGFYVLSAGVLGALALAMTEVTHFWIANTIYLAFVVSTLTSSVVKIVVYRRGV